MREKIKGYLYCILASIWWLGRPYIGHKLGDGLTRSVFIRFQIGFHISTLPSDFRNYSAYMF